MTFDEIRNTLESHLSGVSVPIAWDNFPLSTWVKAAQRDGDPWIRVTVVPGATLHAGKASAPISRRTGLLTIQIFTKLNIGSGVAYGVCDELTPLLQYQLLGDLETLELTVTRAGESNGYYQLNATVPFRADH